MIGRIIEDAIKQSEALNQPLVLCVDYFDMIASRKYSLLDAVFFIWIS